AGVYSLDDVLAAVAPVDRMTCGECGRPLAAEQTDGTWRVSCRARRSQAAPCALVSTRRLSRVQLAAKAAVERALEDEVIVYGLYDDFLAAL
ncbi:hypothetical protein OFM36_32235, partial [Escherichia coli]|nr:hypothetical protein [Escherichia coli]